MQGNVGAELSILLPRESSGRFEALFNALDSSLSTLQVEGYGCTMTTLEEVFLKVGEGDVNEADEAIDIQSRIEKTATKAKSVKQASRGKTGEETMLLMPNSQPPRLQGSALLWQQFKAMLTKRMISATRDKYMLAVQLIPPLFFTFLTIVLTNAAPKVL